MSAGTRTPTAEEIAKERTVLVPTIADTGVLAALFVTAITTGSLTILSEFIRGGIPTIVAYYSVKVLRAQHRGRLSHYEFGVGKLEQLVWVVAGLTLLLGAGWMAKTIFETVVSAEPAASPLGLAIAAVVNAVNLVINSLSLYAMYRASEDRDAGVFGAQVRARVGMVLATLILQVTLTIAALAKDEAITLALDAGGATLVVLIMLVYRRWHDQKGFAVASGCAGR